MMMLAGTLFTVFSFVIMMGIRSYKGVPVGQALFAVLWVCVVAPFVAVALQ